MAGLTRAKSRVRSRKAVREDVRDTREVLCGPAVQVLLHEPADLPLSKARVFGIGSLNAAQGTLQRVMKSFVMCSAGTVRSNER